jgi:uncharacterized membrane protein YfcA
VARRANETSSLSFLPDGTFVTSVTLTSTALGACVGATLSLTGAGGAIIAVPLLMFGVQLSVLQAAPIGLLAVASSAALGTPR